MKIHLRYCSAWAYEPKAVSLAEKVLTEYKQQINRLELEPSMGGCFEVTVNGQLIYSKLETDEFPDEGAIVEQVGQLL